VKLAGFKYLRRQRTLTLILILTITSILFSITAFSFLGYYKSFNVYLGEEEDVVAIYDKKSSTPFTSIWVPTYLTDPISKMNGVLASSPEVMVPCIVKDKSIFLRGIVPEEFCKISSLSMLEGSMLELSDVNSLVVGRSLAERVSLKLGEKVIVLDVLEDQYLELQVKGIYDSDSAMDDEGLVPLYVGQWLRGTTYNRVSLIRVKIDKSLISPSQLLDTIAEEAALPKPSEGGGEENPWIIPIAWIDFGIEDVGVEQAQRFMRSYVDRYGVTRESLLILSIMVFSLASVSVISASKILISQHKGEIEVLKSVGASNKTIKADLIAKVLPWSLVSSVIGMSISILILLAIERSGYVQVLSHAISFHFDPLVLALQLIFTSLIVALSILRSFKSKT